MQNDSPSHLAELERLFAACVDAAPDEVDEILAAEDLPSELVREVRSLLRSASTHPGHPLLPNLGPGSLDSARQRQKTLVGRRLGKFQLVSEISTGGMGTVFVAEEIGLERRVAIKTIRSGLASPETLDRFRTESSLLARLQHPNIATIYGTDLSEIDGIDVPWISMELVEGGRPIDHAIRDDRLARDDLLRLFRNILDAVHHAHVRGIIHRDIKPSNILLTRDDQPKIIDFGIARSLNNDAGNRQTIEGSILGTPRYMSPEQCRGESASADTRSDIFSAGVVLYELLTREHPFGITDQTPLESMKIIASRTPVGLRNRSPKISHDLAAVLEKSLAPEPDSRYQSAADFSEDLRRVIAHEPVTARHLSIGRMAIARVRRHPLVATVTGIMVIAVVAGLVYGSIMTARVHREAMRGQRYINALLQIVQNDSMKDRRADARVTDALDAMTTTALALDLPEDRINRSDIQMVLARAWEHVGFSDRAYAAVSDAFRMRQAALGSDHPETLEAEMVLLELSPSITEIDASVDSPEVTSDSSGHSSRTLLSSIISRHEDMLGEGHPQSLAARATVARTVVRFLPEEEALARELCDRHGILLSNDLLRASIAKGWADFDTSRETIVAQEIVAISDRMASAERAAGETFPEFLLLNQIHRLLLLGVPPHSIERPLLERRLEATFDIEATIQRIEKTGHSLDPTLLVGFKDWNADRFRSKAIETRMITLLRLERYHDVLEVWKEKQSEISDVDDLRLWSMRSAINAAMEIQRREDGEALVDQLEREAAREPRNQDMIDWARKSRRMLGR